MCGFSAVTSISDSRISCSMRTLFASMPTAHCSLKLVQPCVSRVALCMKLVMTSGLNTFSSKLPDAPPKLIATSLPNTWQHAMVNDSDCVGLTLPGMIELPGSFSGMLNSPMPQRGPDASQRTSLAIFINEAASVLSAPCACTTPSQEASASNLLGAVTNFCPVYFASSAATITANFGCAFKPVPTAVPPNASSHKCGVAAFTCCNPWSSCET